MSTFIASSPPVERLWKRAFAFFFVFRGPSLALPAPPRLRIVCSLRFPPSLALPTLLHQMKTQHSPGVVHAPLSYHDVPAEGLNAATVAGLQAAHSHNRDGSHAHEASKHIWLLYIFTICHGVPPHNSRRFRRFRCVVAQPRITHLFPRVGSSQPASHRLSKRHFGAWFLPRRPRCRPICPCGRRS